MRRTPATDDLSAWLDGELADDRVAELEAELQRDPELRAELAQLEEVVRLVREAGPAVAPIGFTHRLMARIEEEDTRSSRSAWAWLRRPWGIPLEGWALGLAAVIALLLLIPFHGSRSTDEPSRNVSPATLELPHPKPPEVSTVEPAPAPNPPAPIARTVSGAAPVVGTPDEVQAPESTDQAVAVEPAPPSGTAEEAKPAPHTPVKAPVEMSVRTRDPRVKRELLSIVSHYGGVVIEDGEPTDGTMRSANESVLVSLPAAQLSNLWSDLKRKGYSVPYTTDGELLTDPITVQIDLEVTPPPKMERAAPASADEAVEGR